MTATVADVVGTVPARTSERLPLWRRILFRTGIVLTVVMGTMNAINGGSALLGIQPGADETSVWLEVLLFGVGWLTLLFAALAWRPRQWALWTLLVLRSLEALTMWIPFGPGDWYQSPQSRGFYLTLVATAAVVCVLLAFGLRRGQKR